MTGTTISSGTLDPRRAKLLFRSWHRGIKEMDIIFGSFADAHLATMHDSDLDEFEMMLETSDRDLLKWFTGEEAVPDVADTPLFQRIVFHTSNMQSPY